MSSMRNVLIDFARRKSIRHSRAGNVNLSYQWYRLYMQLKHRR